MSVGVVRNYGGTLSQSAGLGKKIGPPPAEIGALLCRFSGNWFNSAHEEITGYFRVVVSRRLSSIAGADTRDH